MSRRYLDLRRRCVVELVSIHSVYSHLASCPSPSVVNYQHDGEKEVGRRLLQVIPIAGNLPLEEGHTREAHGLNATSRLGRVQENARHRMSRTYYIFITLRS